MRKAVLISDDTVIVLGNIELLCKEESSERYAVAHMVSGLKVYLTATDYEIVMEALVR